MKRTPLLLVVLLAGACGGSDDDPSCDPLKADACGTEQVCEQRQGGGTICADPVDVQGVVFELADGRDTGGIAGARVVPLDVNGAPVGSAATTGPDGAYTVRVPTVRDGAGKPVAGAVTLRADAEGYATFPSGIRTAVPIDLSTAVAAAHGWTLTSSLTDVGLVADPEAGTASLHGKVAQVTTGGALVVAEPAGGGAGHTGVADVSGEYVILNLPAGDWTVKAYAKGVNHAPAAASALGDGEDRLLDLAALTGATASITGNVQRTGQNQPNPAVATSVILVVRSTYDEALDRGESPPGLVVTVPPDQTAYTLAGVPDGEYVALAAFENDGYVRDVSGIGGTAPVIVTVANGAMTSAQGNFKITGALSFATPAISPSTATEGAAAIITVATPTFDWTAYPSAAEYEVTVFDALGNAIWTPGRFPSATTDAVYAGEALLPNMTYQVRIAVFDTGGSQISRTEDLKGVFTYRP